MKHTLSLLLLLILCTAGFSKTRRVSLSGEWEVKLDQLNGWMTKSSGQNISEGTIMLPGSLAENGFGYKTEGSDYGILTPAYKYIGKA